ncbi:MAG: glycosyltransferase family 87 protein [Acidimicrobiales bacterium]
MTLDASRLAGAWAPLAGAVRRRLVPWRLRWTPELGDGTFYALAATFAGVTAAVSTLPLYRVWGQYAVGPYLGAALVSLVLWRWRLTRARRAGVATAVAAVPGTPAAEGLAGIDVLDDDALGIDALDDGARATSRVPSRSDRRFRAARVWVLAGVLVGATLVPLAVEVAQRGNGQTAIRAQPEVTVIQQAGTRLAHGKDPYHALVRDHHLVSAVRGEPAFESFFPYLPLMAVFGLPHSTHQPVHLTDARIFFSIVTMAVAGLALGLSGAPRGRRLRALQVVAVLPTAALPLATGGDDMPVVALLLLAMVLAQRRRPGWSGIVFGIVSAMKFTAWPMAALALFAARGRDGRRAPGWMLAGMAVVAGPVLAPFAASNLGAFFSNVILFPLGLSGVASPAASNLPGHLLVLTFPWLHRALPFAVAVVGGAYLVRRLVRRPPATASTVAYLTGWVMLVALAFAPATRVGYLLYPANFFIWGWMFAVEDRQAAVVPPASVPLEELVPV